MPRIGVQTRNPSFRVKTIEDISGGTKNMRLTEAEIHSVSAVFKIPPIPERFRRKSIIPNYIQNKNEHIYFNTQAKVISLGIFHGSFGF